MVGVSVNEISVGVANVTYGSASLTRVANLGLVAFYYLLNPAIGTGRVTVALTAMPGLASGGSVSYFNVAGVGASSSSWGLGSVATVTVPSNVSDLVVDVLYAGTGTSTTVGWNQTMRWAQFNGGAGSEKIATSNATAMTWILLGYEGPWRMIAAVLLPQTAIPEFPIGLPSSLLLVILVVGYGLLRRSRRMD